jgi:hypothetical protein
MLAVARNMSRCFDDVATFCSRVSYATLTCCDICILMFRCDLGNVADVEFQCCRHVMLGVVSRRRRGEGGLLMLDVARNTGRNMAAI